MDGEIALCRGDLAVRGCEGACECAQQFVASRNNLRAATDQEFSPRLHLCADRPSLGTVALKRILQEPVALLERALIPREGSAVARLPLDCHPVQGGAAHRGSPDDEACLFRNKGGDLELLAERLAPSRGAVHEIPGALRAADLCGECGRRKRIVLRLTWVSEGDGERTAACLLLDEFAERACTVRATGGCNKQRFDRGGLPSAVRPPEDLWPCREADLSGGPASDLLEAHALNHFVHSSSSVRGRVCRAVCGTV